MVQTEHKVKLVFYCHFGISQAIVVVCVHYKGLQVYGHHLLWLFRFPWSESSVRGGVWRIGIDPDISMVRASARWEEGLGFDSQVQSHRVVFPCLLRSHCFACNNIQIKREICNYMKLYFLNKSPFVYASLLRFSFLCDLILAFWCIAIPCQLHARCSKFGGDACLFYVIVITALCSSLD